MIKYGKDTTTAYTRLFTALWFSECQDFKEIIDRCGQEYRHEIIHILFRQKNDISPSLAARLSALSGLSENWYMKGTGAAYSVDIRHHPGTTLRYYNPNDPKELILETPIVLPPRRDGNFDRYIKKTDCYE